MHMAKQVKLISVENLRPLNPKKDGEFLAVFRQALGLAYRWERERKSTCREQKPEEKE